MVRKTGTTVMVLAVMLLFTASIHSASRTGEEINWQVISGGGSINGTSTSYRLSGTVAQTAVGAGTSTNYGLSHGFWQEFAGGGANCCDLPGDANNEGTVNILDITFLIDYLYGDPLGPAPACMYEGDANGNCTINILDITYLIDYLYGDPLGPAPVCATSCPGW